MTTIPDPGPSPVLDIDVHDGPNPWTRLPDGDIGRRFSFVLISDRTGGARPGVFQRGIAVTDLLAPSFAIQLGDMIEGYTADPDVLRAQWDELDAIVGELRTPLFHLPGNHDVSTPLMDDAWAARYGRRWYHFRCQDVLFCLLDTQDPHFPLDDRQLEAIETYEEQARRDPARFRPQLERAIDWEGTQPASISEEQHAYFAQVLRDHADARHTVLCMHMPIWQGEHPSWSRLRDDLGDRRYTTFSGHVHNYQRRIANGHDHIRLGPTGGLWVLEGPQGNFDQVTQVTVTDDGLVIANVLLDGVRDIDGRPVRPTALTTVALG